MQKNTLLDACSTTWSRLTKHQTLCALMGLLICLSPMARAYDAVADFSTNTNPNGVWSYGMFTNHSSPFGLLPTNYSSLVGTSLVFAYWSGENVPDGVQIIIAELTTNSFSSGTRSYYPDTLVEDPQGEVASVRFTTPATGFYWVKGFYRVQDEDLYLQSWGAALSINTNENWNNPEFSANTLGAAEGTEYWFSFTNYLSQGIPLDFNAACSTLPTQSGNFQFLSTGLKATVTPLFQIIPQIQSPKLTNSNFTMSFPTVSNQSYTVQQNTNLGMTNWISCTNFIGGGSVFQFTTPVAGQPQIFYRIKMP